MTWLITGGAGYIGAHVVFRLLDAGERVVILDDLSTGNPQRIDEVQRLSAPGISAPLVIGSLGDRALLEKTIADHSVRGVIHLAAKKSVAESVQRPLHYYEQNVSGLITLLDVCVQRGVEDFVYSSSAAVYGEVDVAGGVPEGTPLRPKTPYGETKLIGEWLVNSCAIAHGLHATCLRYFNVAGCLTPAMADTRCDNLVPIAVTNLKQGRVPLVFGDNYPTHDGTCVRDFIHVDDVARAHVLAAGQVKRNSLPVVFNVGTGKGHSVMEVLTMTGALCGSSLRPKVAPPRTGDAAEVVADVRKIRADLGFEAKLGLEEILASACSAYDTPAAKRSRPFTI